MNKKEKRIKELNEMKERDNVLICEIVVGNEREADVIFRSTGDGANIRQIAKMISCLEDMANDLAKEFPEAYIISKIRPGKMKTKIREIH